MENDEDDLTKAGLTKSSPLKRISYCEDELFEMLYEV